MILQLAGSARVLLFVLFVAVENVAVVEIDVRELREAHRLARTLRVVPEVAASLDRQRLFGYCNN